MLVFLDHRDTLIAALSGFACGDAMRGLRNHWVAMRHHGESVQDNTV